MTVSFSHSDGIATITLNRPAQLNAMDWSTYDELTDAFRAIDAHPDILVGVITGAGDRAFSAGADLKGMHGVDQEPDSAWKPWTADRWDFGATPSKPMVAAINGYALAGGLELALMCDIRIASETAQFGAPETKWDLLHGYGAYRLPRVVGLSHAMEMMLTGEFIDAETALRIGLVSRVLPAEEVLPTALGIAQKIASNAPTAVRMTKDLVQRGLELPLENYLRLLPLYYERAERSQDQRDRLRTFATREASS